MNPILSGDIGGTKTLLQISTAGNPRTPLLQKSFPSNQYAGLAEIIDEFLHQSNTAAVAGACLALAGPVLGRRVNLTNLPWSVDADEISARFGIPRVSLINDFEAAGMAIEALQPADLLTLQPGTEQKQGARLVVGAGTGLGVAWITWQDGKYQVHPSEGGHMDFAPANAIEYELLCHLQKQHGHVSYERIASGPGLLAIFEFLQASGHATAPLRLLAAMKEGDPAAVIAQSAQQSDEPAARMALDIFLSVYGAFTGNMALAALPRGGIYIAGGIAAKIAPQLRQGAFLQAFRNKGRYAGLLESVPVHLVTHPHVGLLGASLAAQRLLQM